MLNSTVEQKEAILIEKIARCKTILDEMQNSKAWPLIFEDFAKAKDNIDSNWQYMTDPIKLGELRVSKMAIQTILNTILTYEHDMHKAEEELDLIRNPKSAIQKDWDTEGIK